MSDALGSDDGRSSGMSLSAEQDRSLVTLYGEIDLAVRQGAAEVCHELTLRARPVVIDASRVTFVDSAGMSVLVRIARDAEAGGYPVVLQNAPWILKELLTITGVDRLLPFAEGEEAPEHPTSPPSQTAGA